ncbi:LysR substrate-binding domain-containing protein [Roseibium litorale]|uniref:LysR family transcriptional regulator n=1 Tax=Roseibium litorale TaxID=2803841 RepID=A0ABR9CNC0_9HYPH|nr:LysR substrate-binding domain-containing protein [Roseibium litorale]MBD8892388.1 LysR family transcriptional regulator [Roseibium litorale]
MQNLNRVHLAGLRAVEAVARLGSLKAAAEELGVTPGAVSQQVQKTELQLGMPLFDRHPRGLTPTRNAAPILHQLTAGMTALSAAVAMTGRGREDALTVSVAPVFAGKWLVWHLRDFNKAHPDIRVRVDARVDLVDPDSSDVDLCIRVGKGPYKGVNAEKLRSQRVFPVCSPAIAEQLKTPSDLANVPIIKDPGQMFSWNEWLTPNGLDMSILGKGPTFSDGSLCLDAAIAGQGVFLAWETLAYHALEVGQIVRPFPGSYQTPFSYWLISGKHSPPTKAMKVFSAWLKEELACSLSGLA